MILTQLDVNRYSMPGPPSRHPEIHFGVQYKCALIYFDCPREKIKIIKLCETAMVV